MFIFGYSLPPLLSLSLSLSLSLARLIHYLSSIEFELSIGVSSVLSLRDSIFILSLLPLLIPAVSFDTNFDGDESCGNAAKYGVERSLVANGTLISLFGCTNGSATAAVDDDELFGELQRPFLKIVFFSI